MSIHKRINKVKINDVLSHLMNPGTEIEKKKKDDILHNTISYLAGPIDCSADDGLVWRSKLIKLCEAAKLGIRFLDPTRKLGDYSEEVGIEKQKHTSMKLAGDYDGITKYMKPIVRYDLRCVDMSDFLIAYVDKDIHMCGTHCEIQIADMQHKPVLVITKGGKHLTPSWLFGILDHNLFFGSIEECVDYLVKINSGKVEVDDKWVLIRKYLAAGKSLNLD